MRLTEIAKDMKIEAYNTGKSYRKLWGGLELTLSTLQNPTLLPSVLIKVRFCNVLRVRFCNVLGIEYRINRLYALFHGVNIKSSYHVVIGFFKIFFISGGERLYKVLRKICSHLSISSILPGILTKRPCMF